MHSLGSRLMATLALVLLSAWAGWFAIQYVSMSAQQGGEADSMLRTVAEQLLTSLPADIATAGRQQQFAPSRQVAPVSGKFASIGFQVWEPGTGRRLLSSRSAPEHPMAPGFSEGFTDATVANEAWRVFSLSDQQRRIHVQVGLPKSALHAELMRWLRTSLGIALLLLLGMAVAVGVVIHWSLRSVVKISGSLAARAPVDLAPLPENGLPCELTPLVRSFNELLQKLGGAMQRERDFLGEAAHELRTPLAALLAQAQVLQHADDAVEARQALEQLVIGIERTSRLAQQLLDTARVQGGGGAARAVDLDLSMIAAMVADEFELIAGRAGQSIEVEGGFVPVHGDIDDLGILVRNLVDNALRHGGAGVRVRLETRVGEVAGVPAGILVVSDDGPGISRADHKRVFERFYRAGDGPRAKGVGMGLSLVERVVAAHGGRLHCGPGMDGRGFSVEVQLPVSATGRLPGAAA